MEGVPLILNGFNAMLLELEIRCSYFTDVCTTRLAVSVFLDYIFCAFLD
jgi:hypothetical protein